VGAAPTCVDSDGESWYLLTPSPSLMRPQLATCAVTTANRWMCTVRLYAAPDAGVVQGGMLTCVASRSPQGSWIDLGYCHVRPRSRPGKPYAPRVSASDQQALVTAAQNAIKATLQAEGDNPAGKEIIEPPEKATAQRQIEAAELQAAATQRIASALKALLGRYKQVVCVCGPYTSIG
jgi:hypothetical protein